MGARLWKRIFMKIVLWTVMGILIILAFLGAIAAWDVFKKERMVKQELELVSEHLVDLEERKDALEGTLGALDSERGIEYEIRKRFPLGKQGEEVIVLLDASNAELTQTASSSNGVWQSFLDWFSR